MKALLKSLRYLYFYLVRFHRFGSVGRHTVMKKPLRIMNGKHIVIGDYCYILDGVRFDAMTRHDDQEFEPEIRIGDRVEIGQGCQISAAESIIIEDNVSLAPYVMLNDTTHGYRDMDTPIERQPLTTGPIIIGEGSIIGYSSVILPGVTIGKHCFIGANAVIAHDVPDYTIVANHSNLVTKTIRKQDEN